MLFHVLLLGDAPEIDLLADALPSPDVVVGRVAATSFWSEPGRHSFDLVVLCHGDLTDDLSSAIGRVRSLEQRPEVVVLAESLTDREILDLQAAGCFAVVPSGLTEEPLTRAMQKVVERRRETLAARMESHGPRLKADDWICRSSATQNVVRIARRVAVSDTSVLLLGETGAGKEWLARVIHGESPRASGPFVAVNCGAIPEGLLESELFGHEKGAFTGAVKARRGFFEQAHGGTLFLDEIGDMAGHLQVRLLRSLQDRSIQRLGGEEVVPVDTRVIAATHRDLKAAMDGGGFRRDLYYRLAVVTLVVPALRERPEDIPLLADRYLREFVRKFDRSEIEGFTASALEALGAYPWPGNVRELINVIERAVLLCDGDRIDWVDLPLEVAAPAEPGSSATGDEAWVEDIEHWIDQPVDVGRQAVVADFERRYFTRLLQRNRGHIGRTAEQAGIDPRTLYNKLRQLGLKKSDFKGLTPQASSKSSQDS